MKIDELQAFLEDELSYSVSHDAVLSQVGSAELEAPDADETETISNIIDAVGQESYDSAEELFATVLGNVNDDYIGRKFYDDRGGNPIDELTNRRDETEISF
ncbi:MULTISPECIES: hypothetical protein [Haloarcula]|uniref:DUF5789 family protein n=1 Tax=Haloarcula TaxID=2237 RepID=UPI0023E8C4B4|nr:hypothetical protein [Halomicroarcula sp. SHR3]